MFDKDVIQVTMFLRINNKSMECSRRTMNVYKKDERITHQLANKTIKNSKKDLETTP